MIQAFIGRLHSAPIALKVSSEITLAAFGLCAGPRPPRRTPTDTNTPNPVIDIHQVVGSGTAETVPEVEAREGLEGELQAASTQLASFTVPTAPPLLPTSITPPESVNPAGEIRLSR